MINKRLIAALLFFVYGASSSASQGSDNEMWVKGYIEATGSGVATLERFRNSGQARLMAKRAAIVDAQRNLVSIIEGVRVTSGTVVKDMMVESDTVATRVKGLLRGAFITSNSLSNEGDSFVADVTMGVCLSSRVDKCMGKPSIASVVYSNLSKQQLKPASVKQEQKPELKPKQTQVVSAAAEVKNVDSASSATLTDTDTQIVLDKNSGGVHTGVVVDLQNIDFEPALMFRLVSDNGDVVYDSRDYADLGSDIYPEPWYESTIMRGIRVAYMGENPLVIRAAKNGKETDLSSDIVISQNDVDAIMQADSKNDVFKKTLVTLVIK